MHVSIGTRCVAAASIVLFLAACADQPTTPPSVGALSVLPSSTMSFSRAGSSRQSDHVVIETKGAESSDFVATVTALGGQVERRLPQVNFVVVKGLNASAVASLSKRGDVATVTRDVQVRWIPSTRSSQKMTSSRGVKPPTVDQSTAFFFDQYQWNMKVTKANEAWLTTPEGFGANVYILDTGIDPFHGDLVGLVDLVKSASFVESEPGFPFDFEAHGTFTAALVTSNGIGMASVAPLAKLVAVKVLDATGFGSFADVIEGIVYAADQGADVINMSLGAYADLSNPDDRQLVAHLQAAILYARAKGSVVVASAGNDAVNLATFQPASVISIPAELIGVISVGATGPTNQQNFDNLASYSNFGWDKHKFGGVQIFAPGGEPTNVAEDWILSACSQFAAFGCGPFDYLIGVGTSASAPHVSGEAAVLRSILGGSTSASFANHECVLKGTDNIGPKKIFGEGRMNVVKAAKCAKNAR